MDNNNVITTNITITTTSRLVSLNLGIMAAKVLNNNNNMLGISNML